MDKRRQAAKIVTSSTSEHLAEDRAVPPQQARRREPAGLSKQTGASRYQVRATRARVQRGREKNKIGWQTSVGSISAPLGCVLARARTSETKLSTTPKGAGECGVTSPKESAKERGKARCRGDRTNGYVRLRLRGNTSEAACAARAMKVERAPDTTEGALGVESGMPLTGRSRKHPGAAGLRCSALVRV